jgi:dolichol-phosphate mannosyltransferase
VSLLDTEATAAKEAGGPRIAIVVALFKEAENVAPVTAEILAVARPLGEFELIYVDDGSDDATLERLHILRAHEGAI